MEDLDRILDKLDKMSEKIQELAVDVTKLQSAQEHMQQTLSTASTEWNGLKLKALGVLAAIAMAAGGAGSKVGDIVGAMLGQTANAAPVASAQPVAPVVQP